MVLNWRSLNADATSDKNVQVDQLWCYHIIQLSYWIFTQWLPDVMCYQHVLRCHPQVNLHIMIPSKVTNTGCYIMMNIHNHWCFIYFQGLSIWFRRLLICQIVTCSIYTGIRNSFSYFLTTKEIASWLLLMRLRILHQWFVVSVMCIPHF